MTFDLRLVAYEPDGGTLGLLPYPLAVSAGLPLCDRPATRLVYANALAGGDLLGRGLDTGLEVAVETIWDGGSWTEPPNARFILTARDTNPLDRTGRLSLVLPGYSWMLRKVGLLNEAELTSDGRRRFQSFGGTMSAGTIMGTLIDEAHARGTLPGLSYDFTSTHDSAGQPWVVTNLRVEYEATVNLWQILLGFVDQDLVEWRMQGRTLQMFNPSAALMVDRTTTDPTVDLRLGVDVVDAPDHESIEDRASRALVRGKDSLRAVETDESAVTPWGHWETAADYRDLADLPATQMAAQVAIAKSRRAAVQHTRALSFAGARHLPFRDYGVGDVVWGPGTGGAREDLRVRQITLTRDVRGVVGGNVVLGDRFIAREVRASRRLNFVASRSGGSTSSPEPAAPSSPYVSVYTTTITGSDGQFMKVNASRMLVGWSAVTETAEGVPVDVASYEVQAKPTTGTESWTLLSTTTDTFVDVPRASRGSGTLDVRVRAVSAQGVASAWSPVSTSSTLASSVSPPSAPILSVRNGVVRAEWNGNTSAGSAMPLAAFDHVDVAASTSPTPTAVVGRLTGAGSIVLPDLTYNSTVYVRLRAVSTTGEVSAWSVAQSIGVAPIQSYDLPDGVVEGSKLAADAIDGRTITGAYIRTDDTGPRWEMSSPNANQLFAITDHAYELFPGGVTVWISEGSATPGHASPRDDQAVLELSAPTLHDGTGARNPARIQMFGTPQSETAVTETEIYYLADRHVFGGGSIEGSLAALAGRYSKSFAQSIPNATWTTITGWTVVAESDAGMSPTSSSWTLTRAGWWELDFRISWAAFATARRAIKVRRTRSGVITDLAQEWDNAGDQGGNHATSRVSELNSFLAGDVIEVQVYQDTGAALSTLNDATQVRALLRFVGT